ncbi:hypothetical protein DLE60_23170 [Micromonospora globispora]|nr:hypothetical protein DLE60_23170 [Micromonospora globispora]
MFPQLASLVIEQAVEQGRMVCVRARTPATAVACPGCGHLILPPRDDAIGPGTRQLRYEETMVI